jgi:crotonobetainyl-CoA:carnitine CoA-transferase CaiB-like acyl-CoA transferase
MIMASIKGFGPGKYEDCKVYENVAQCAGGSASTTGFLDDIHRLSPGRRSAIPAPDCIWRWAS